jgi:hypothetical protein
MKKYGTPYKAPRPTKPATRKPKPVKKGKKGK